MSLDVATHPITEIYDPLSYDPVDPFQDAVLPRVRREAPVFFDGRYDMYFTTAYAETRDVLGDWRRFSSKAFINFPPVFRELSDALPEGYPQAYENAEGGGGNIATLDPPEHTRIRRVAQH